MRGRSVLILLILVVGLVAFIELYEHELPSSEERAELDKLVLTTEASEVTGVELSWDGQTVRLERQGSESQDEQGELDLATAVWHLVEPMTARADTELVTPLVESLTSLEKRRALEGTTLEEVGLRPPRLTATLIAGDKASDLLVGSEIPAGNAMIVSTSEGDGVYVVDDVLWPDLTRAPGDWRSRNVFEVGQGSVSKVVLREPDREIVATRRGQDFWLEEPVVDLADAEKLGTLLTSLASMRVAEFVDEAPDLAGLGLDPPLAIVELFSGKSTEPLRLSLGRLNPDSETLRYALKDGQVFTVEEALETFLATSVEEWRSLDLTSLETFQIDAVEIGQSGHDRLTLVRDGANWQRGQEEISFTTVSDFLYAIAGARASSLWANPGGEAPHQEGREAVLEIVLGGAEVEQTVRFYALAEEGAQTRVDNRDVVLFVEHDEFTEILEKVSEIRAADAVKTEGAE